MCVFVSCACIPVHAGRSQNRKRADTHFEAGMVCVLTPRFKKVKWGIVFSQGVNVANVRALLSKDGLGGIENYSFNMAAFVSTKFISLRFSN